MLDAGLREANTAQPLAVQEGSLAESLDRQPPTSSLVVAHLSC